MLEIRNLTKTYGGNQKPSVDNLTLTVGDGEIFGFIGPNGAGKSTTIKSITGIIDFEDGSISLDGIDIKQNPIEAKKILGYVSDDHVLYEGLTGVEYINFICDVFDVPTAQRQPRLDKYAEFFALQDAINKQISTYSHGMKQKVALIAALAHNPKVLIMDEPFVGLDPKAVYDMKEIMRDMAKDGKTIFFSTHILDVAEKLCDRVAIIKDGTIVKVGKMKDIKGDESLEQVFLELGEK